jgi:hypothetical protein
VFRVGGTYRWLTFYAGVSEEMTEAGSITAQVWLDGKKVHATPVTLYFICGSTMPLRITFWHNRNTTSTGIEFTTNAAMSVNGWVAVCENW